MRLLLRIDTEGFSGEAMTEVRSEDGGAGTFLTGEIARFKAITGRISGAGGGVGTFVIGENPRFGVAPEEGSDANDKFFAGDTPRLKAANPTPMLFVYLKNNNQTFNNKVLVII
jgi:hypothetical protein